MGLLIVAIPTYNEEAALPRVLKSIRKSISFHKENLVLVVDDGSIDKTIDVACEFGADIIVSHEKNLGVAQAYKTAIKTALLFGADVICTIDGDGQFDPHQIPKLVKPILMNEADLVIGSRFINREFSRNIPTANRIGNNIIASLVSLLIGKRVRDTESGFRAISRNAAANLKLLGLVSFSNDMILDLSWKGKRILEIPVRVKYYEQRESRVIQGFLKYGFKSMCTIVMKALSFRLSFKARVDYCPKARILRAPETLGIHKLSVSEEKANSLFGEFQQRESVKV